MEPERLIGKYGRLIARMERIEQNMATIFVRHDHRTVAFTELPASVAAFWIFKWLREVIDDDLQQSGTKSNG